MHYLLSVIDDRITPGEPDEPGAVEAFNDQLKADGRWVFGGGLEPLDAATVVDVRSGGTTVTDGPFAESKEWLGGLTIVDVPDDETARMWAGKIAEGCGWPQEVRRFKPRPPG
jgi:hypothetical protein